MYNLSAIMYRAWRTFRKGGITFSEALHRSWLSAKAQPVNAERIEAARIAAGISEPVETWNGWRTAGREVIHGERALFQVDLLYGSHGDGAIYRASFFAESQTEPLTAA